jgi:AraC-like DNA-binding protein
VNAGILRSRIFEIERKMLAGAGHPDEADARELTLGTGMGRGVRALRTYLSKRAGRGYWDIVEVTPGFYLIITDVFYRESHRLTLPSENVVKLRVVCEGRLYLTRQSLELTEGAVCFQRTTGDEAIEYIVSGNLPLRMVVAHVTLDCLEGLGIVNELLPKRLRSLLASDSPSCTAFPVETSAKIIRIAKDIVESRERLIGDMRQSYVRGKGYELVCEAAMSASVLHDRRTGTNRLRHRDIVRFHEVKRLIANDLRSALTIERLSRMLGMNRTKLKAGFRETFGETIQGYRTRVRLAEAVRLLETTDLPMAEIGRRLGYGHAANFSQVVSRHFGVRPLDIRKKGWPGRPGHFPR